ncbi:MAG: GAF domain-containing protein, partial [Caldilineae bacterium]
DSSPVQLSDPETTAPAGFEGSVVGLRLSTPQTPLAVLLLTHSRPRYFNDLDAEFLEALLPIVTLAMENAHTYSRLAVSNRQLSTLHSINALTYNAELPLQRVLRLAVEGIRQNMGYHAVFICLPEENGQALSIRAACGKLDKSLRRRGDTPTRRIAFSLAAEDNPFSHPFISRQTQNRPLADWIAALEKANAPDMARVLQKQPITHIVGLPLWRGDDVIGVLAVGHAHGETLPRQDKSLLTTLANQISLVITNANLYQSEQQRRREMEALYRAGLVITSTLSHAEVLKAITQQIVELTFVESCIISRWDTASDAEVIEIYLQKLPGGWTEVAPAGTRYPLATRPLVREALQEQQLKIVSLDDPSLPSTERNWMAKTQAKLRLIMPLIVRNKSIGVIELITTRAHQRFTGHIIRLIQGLAAQASIALENARLHEAEVKRIEQEMDLARRIQLSLLPEEAPHIPGLSIAARSASARLVGGDFYRYLTLPDGRFGIVVGDVSGKGVPSALFMAITLTALDTQLRQQTSPEGLLNRLNNALYPRMHANRMNTGLLVGTFNLQQNEVEFANAGMIAPLIQRNKHAQWLDVSGLPVGADPHATYRGAHLALTPGTTILLASDGILEAQNPAGELYGFERFEAAARQIPPDATSDQILEHIWQDTTRYLNGADPHDDMTLAVIKVQPAS